MALAECDGMLKTLLGISQPDLERELLRKGVGAREVMLFRVVPADEPSSDRLHAERRH